MKHKKADSLAQRVYDGVRNRILSGEYALSSPLSRRVLAAEFGVSLLPVAEALQRLENEGLIESRPRSGTRVRVPTHDEIIGNYLVREALEVQAARLFAENAGSRECKQLVRSARELDALYDASPLARMDRKSLFNLHRVHFDFHVQVASSTGVRELLRAIESNHVLIFHWVYNTAAPFDRLPAAWHQQLVEALVSGDAEKAEKAMRKHVRYRREEVAERIAAYGTDTRPAFRAPRAAQVSA